MESKTQIGLFTYTVLVVTFCQYVTAASVNIIDKNSNKAMCSEIPKMVLSEVLGSAFNSRYMSISQPDDPEPDEGKYKRRSDTLPAFYVEDTFTREIDNQPGWPWNTEAKNRRKRSSKTEYQWKCESKLHWIDLGLDYFPQYLRSVECTSKNCWYGMFKCRPRSFTVKLLRRKKDRCVVAKTGTSLGMEGLPIDLRELWVWEERAVNFCCDCAV